MTANLVGYATGLVELVFSVVILLVYKQRVNRIAVIIGLVCAILLLLALFLNNSFLSGYTF